MPVKVDIVDSFGEENVSLGGSIEKVKLKGRFSMKKSIYEQQDFPTQFHHIFEIIEPQFTFFNVHSRDVLLSFSSILKEFIKEYDYKDKEKVEFENLLEFQKFVDEKCDYLCIAVPLLETYRRSIARVIAAYSGDAIFIGDHHHIYQPERFDKEFANYIHEKISHECYEKMSRLYRFYSVDIGPTLAEWFRTERPDIFKNLIKSHRMEPFMPQAYTHRILPLVKEDEDLRVEILAGLFYHERTFGLPEGNHPLGMWLPECCINERVARELALSGIDFVILRSDQTNYIVNPTIVYQLKIRDREKEVPPLTIFYYHPFSREFSFDKWTTDSPAQTLSHFLSNAEKNRYYLLAHDGELVHHRYEHSGVDVTGFFRELPCEVYRRNNPFIIFMNPGRYMQFLYSRSFILGEELQLAETELPDFPTSWSCGGYGLRTFFEEKGETIESLKEKDDDELLKTYAEFLVLRDLQRSDSDPIQEDSWKIMVKMKQEELVKRYHDTAETSWREKIFNDLKRGVNICYDNRRYLGMKIAGAGRWAFGSLDSGDSDYQTSLFNASLLLESQVNALLCRKTDGLFHDRARAKAFFLSGSMEYLHDLKGDPEERHKLLNDYYNGTVSPEEISRFKSKEEFFQEFLIKPEAITDKEKDEIFSLFILWSRIRASQTSCAYFFDDLNNHVSEDAVLRIAEVIYQLEDIYKERINPEVFENLRNCKSRYRTARGQGPETTAYEIATRHLNILRIQHNLTKFEGITQASFLAYIKENPYSLPHPEGSSREYYRAFINKECIGFTSQDGVELLLSKISREVARTGRDIHMLIEKRDLESGEIINRLQMDVKYDQLIAEKPYAPSSIDPNIYLSIKIDEKLWPAISNFAVNTILPLLSDYGIEQNKIRTVYINKDRFDIDYADEYTRSRRKGPSKNSDALLLKKGITVEQLMKFKNDLRFIVREKDRITRDFPGIENVKPLWMEKLPGHIERLMHDRRIQLIVYGYDGNPGLLKKIEYSRKTGGTSLSEVIESSLRDLKDTSHNLNINLLKTFVLYRLFISVDFAMGKYEIEQKVRHNRKITMKDAVVEYCKKENIPYVDEMVAFKLWKYRKEEIKRFWSLKNEEEKLRRFLHQNLILKSADEENDAYHVITHPIIYLHGAANEVFNEAFYPDNEVIPRVVESSPANEVSLCFLPGSVAFIDQYSYLRKIRHYLGEKFSLNKVYGALFACGEQREIEKIKEKEDYLFVLPSLVKEGNLGYFPREKHRQISSSHLKFNFNGELVKFKDYLDTCDIIYFGGGHSLVLCLRLLELSLPIKEGEIPFKHYLTGFLLRGGLLMGLSAGAMVMGTKIINYKIKKMQIANDVDGLGLVNGIFQVHFEEYGLPEHLKEIKTKYPDFPAIGIDTHTGLIDFSTVKIITQHSPAKSTGNFEGIKNVELLRENLVVRGEKNIALRNNETTIFLDGEELFLPRAFFNYKGTSEKTAMEAPVAKV